MIRDIELKEGVFAIYGSGWVLARDDEPMGSRFMPPFQGNAGGPNGGPLFNVHGRDVDMFFLPLGVRPGSLLEVGDIFRMAGPIMPTLPSKVEYDVTAPDGAKRTFKGRANAVGYYYVASDDFELDQPGLWTVDLTVTHDGMTSAGPVQEPYPTGGPLTPDGRTFTFVVTDNDTQSLSLATNLTFSPPETWYGGLRRPRFEAPLPQGWTGKTAHLTVTMPGIVLVERDIPIEDGTISWLLDGEEMNRLAKNFDYENGVGRHNHRYLLRGGTVQPKGCGHYPHPNGARVPPRLLQANLYPLGASGPPAKPVASQVRSSFSQAILKAARRDGNSMRVSPGLSSIWMARKCSGVLATITHTLVTTGTR